MGENYDSLAIVAVLIGLNAWLKGNGTIRTSCVGGSVSLWGWALRSHAQVPPRAEESLLFMGLALLGASVLSTSALGSLCIM